MPTRHLLDDCFLHDRDRLRHDAALAILRDGLGSIVDMEDVPLDEAAGRIAAAEVTAPRPVPLTDNAAVDGYAFAHADYVAQGGRLPVVVRIAAGHRADTSLGAGEAARIFTGAVMPEGADSVAMQEDCETETTGDKTIVSIPAGLKPGANRRRAGEDLAEGTTLIAPGRVLSAQDIAAIASTGADRVTVHRPLTVTVFSSGDEIVEPGASLVAGQVYDANKTLLKALTDRLPVTVIDGGILPDDAAVVADRLKQAAASSHAIITSGGASRGEEDHLIATLDELGSRKLWQLAIKPGRPMSFGRIDDCAVFGLPGNPVAAFVCFLLYVRPALLTLGGADWHEPVRFPLPAGFDVPKKKPDRREFLRGILKAVDGKLVADKFARDGSGLITGLREADGLIEIPEETTSLRAGETVAFIPFSEFGL